LYLSEGDSEHTDTHKKKIESINCKCKGMCEGEGGDTATKNKENSLNVGVTREQELSLPSPIPQSSLS
jgi:hypothetical protein